MKKAGIRIGRKTLAALLSCAMVFATVPLTAVSVMADDSTVTIYHTNDIHGKLNSTYAKDGTLSQIGMDVLATAKKNTPNSLLVDSGDVSQGHHHRTVQRQLCLYPDECCGLRPDVPGQP